MVPNYYLAKGRLIWPKAARVCLIIHLAEGRLIWPKAARVCLAIGQGVWA